MSRDRTRPGDDALSDSERARRELEKRLRAALIEGEEPIPDEEEQEDDAPLPLTDRVEDAPEVLAEIAPVAVEEAPAATPVEAPAEPAPAPQAPAEPAMQGRVERTPQPNLWNRLPRIPVDPARMERNLVITANRHDPAHAAFDVLRTRMIQAMRDKGWHRVGITSPTAGCGKSFTAINLGVSLSRLNDFRTVLLDFDLHRPGLSRILGLKDMPATADFLRGEIGAEDYLSTFAPNMLNIGDRLALGVNGRVEPFASELFANPRSAEVIARMQTDLQADLVLFDLPPALAMDDVLALRPHLDCVLIVVGGGETRARDMREVQSRLGEDMPILGVVMNKAEVDGSAGYSYGY
ncbi:MAG: exopolysaccharide biosynthesis protein [Nioella sp.]|nr:exopolysaccharide biosynthesis protein [Nioella sp.]